MTIFDVWYWAFVMFVLLVAAEMIMSVYLED